MLRNKIFDFFGFKNLVVMKWSEFELYEISKMDFAKDRGQSEIKTNLFFPMIVYQFDEFHLNLI